MHFHHHVNCSPGCDSTQHPQVLASQSLHLCPAAPRSCCRQVSGPCSCFVEDWTSFCDGCSRGARVRRHRAAVNCHRRWATVTRVFLAVQMREANTSILESHNSVWKHWQGLSAHMSQPRWLCLVRHLAWMNNEDYIRRARRHPPTPRFRSFVFDGTKVSNSKLGTLNPNSQPLNTQP